MADMKKVYNDLIIINVLSASIFLECCSAPAPYQTKECHSHFAPCDKKEWHSSLALSKKSALFLSLFLKEKNLFNKEFSCYAQIWQEKLPVKNQLIRLHWNYIKITFISMNI